MSSTILDNQDAQRIIDTILWLRLHKDELPHDAEKKIVSLETVLNNAGVEIF